MNTYDPASGTGPFLDAENGLDTCGDIEQSVLTRYLLDRITLACVDSDNDGFVEVEACTSWDNNQVGNCTSAADAIPSTAAKCRCEKVKILNLPVPQVPTTTTTTTTSTTSTTTTSTTSTTTTTTTTSTTSTTSSTTTTSTTTTTVTTVPVCDCSAGPAFVAARQIKFNNDAIVDGSAVVTEQRGLLRTGKNVFATDGSTFTADRIILGNATSAYGVVTNQLLRGMDATVRDGSAANPPGIASFPVPLPGWWGGPACAVAAVTCNTHELRVLLGETLGPIVPGAYGRVRILNGGTLLLEPGDYQFCDIVLGRGASMRTSGVTTLAVAGSVRVGSGSYLGPDPPDGQTPRLDVVGSKVRVSQGATLRARVTAPDAKITLGRDSTIEGCFCADQQKSDKHITARCRL